MLGFGALGEFALGEFPITPAPIGGGQWGFNPGAERNRRKRIEDKAELAALLKRLLGLAPSELPQEIASAKALAVDAVAKIEAKPLPYNAAPDIAAMQNALLHIAKLESLLRSYGDEEDDDDLLLFH